MPVVDGGQRGNGVDHQEGGMAGTVHGLAHIIDARGGAGRGFIMNDAHGLDLVSLVGVKRFADLVGQCTAPPVGFDEDRFKPEPAGQLAPQRSKVAGLAHQDLVAGRQRVDQRCFPRAGAGSRIDDDVALGLEDGLHAIEALGPNGAELRSAVVDGRIIHRAQDSIRHVGRARNLQKMAACLMHV